MLTAQYRLDSYVESLTAALSLINALVTALGIYDQKRTMKCLKQLETVWEKHQVYFNPAK